MSVKSFIHKENGVSDLSGSVPFAQFFGQRIGADPRLRRILLTTDTVGGVWTYALELARGLEEQGIEVALATMGGPLSKAQRRQISHCSVSQVYESQFCLEWMEEPWKDLHEAGEWLLQLEQEVRPDVVHLNHYVHGRLPWKAPVLVVGHSCVLSWWLSVKGCDAPSSWDHYRQQVRQGIQAADAVVAPSAWMRTALQMHYGPLRHSLTILNGRRPENFPSRPKEPFIFSAGRFWDEGKNVAALCRVAPSLPWPCFLAGEPPATPASSTAGTNETTIHWLGKISEDEMANWLSRAPLYVLPAKYEPFGLSAVEAGLAGCALVLGDIPSLRELWDGAAVFVHPEDEQALEHHLYSLIKHQDVRAMWSDRAQRRAQEFSVSDMISHYRTLYEQLVRQSSGESPLLCVS